MSEALMAEQLKLAGLQKKDAALAAPRKRLHSKYDPWKEAEAQLPENPDPDRVLIVFGAGLGYAVRLMLDRKLTVIWIEPEQELLQEGLRILDFTEELKSGRLRIAQSIDAANIHEWRLSNQSVSFWSHRAFLTPSLAALKGKTEFLLNRHSVNQATLARFEKVWSVNLCANLIHLQSAHSVKRLFGLHRGLPAVVVGAGPSLTDSLESLKESRTKAVYIAVDTAVRVLRHAGIDPDYIVTVDPQPVNRVFLEGYAGQASIVLDPTVSHHSARYASKSRVYVTSTPFQLGRLFGLMLAEEPGELAFGGSVSTNAYDLARRMGCDPVYLVGQDLAFSDGQVHARGAALEERLSWKEGRSWRREMHNFQQLTAIEPLTVEDLRGGLSQTNGKLAIFFRWFEARFEADLREGLQIVNCTPRGALFANVRHGSLTELTRDVQVKQPESIEESRNAPMLRARVTEMVESLRAIDGAYVSAWKVAGSERIRALERLGETLRRTPELELMGNTAQRAIQSLGHGGAPDDSVVELHEALHRGCRLLLRGLGRVERILRDREALRNSGESPQTPAQ